MAYISFLSAQNETAPHITLAGEWVISNLTAIEAEVNSYKKQSITRNTIVDGSNLEKMDISSAWVLSTWLQELSSRGATVTLKDFPEAPQRLLQMVQKQQQLETKQTVTTESTFAKFFVQLGKAVYTIKEGFIDFTAFSGRAFAALLGVILRPQRLRGTSVVYHMYEVGVRAIPIVALMSFLVAIVTGYQGIVQLRQFGAEIYTIDLVAISMLREMAVLITAIMVAGRSGSAFTAEIGVMKTNEEVDALRTMGLDVFEILVLPRLIAIMIVLPLLTIVADAAAMLANLMVSITLLDVGAGQFIERVQNINIKQFNIGIFKAPFFAFLIGMVGCLRGFQVKGAAEEVGKYTTRAVVDSIFLVITMDALFSIIFSHLGY